LFVGRWLQEFQAKIPVLGALLIPKPKPEMKGISSDATNFGHPDGACLVEWLTSDILISTWLNPLFLVC
jgi:hypothetical protein